MKMKMKIKNKDILFLTIIILIMTVLIFVYILRTDQIIAKYKLDIAKKDLLIKDYEQIQINDANTIMEQQIKINKYMIDFGIMGEQAKLQEEKIMEMKRWIDDIRTKWISCSDFCNGSSIIPWTIEKLKEVKL